MNKTVFTKPTLIYLYGFPGSGKSYVGRNLADSFQTAYVNAGRLRSQLFSKPRNDKEEDSIVNYLTRYLAKEFLSTGVSVIYDSGTYRAAQRREIRELAKVAKAESLLIWLQIDAESAYDRTQKRDRRTSDDKYAPVQTRKGFDALLSNMQNPKGEDYIVVSGKHGFPTQKSAIMNRLYQLGLMVGGSVQQNIVKPGLVNLVPKATNGRVDLSRRNVVIR